MFVIPNLLDMKKLTLLLLLFSATTLTHSQELESILLAAQDDANKLTEAYMKPAMTGLIYGMNSGWYHTAKVHNKLGFDISFGLNASFAPSKDEVFNFANLGLTSITSTSTTTPTIMGSGDGATMNVSSTVEVQGVSQNVTATFDMPSGIQGDLPLNAVPTPAVQLSLGLPYKFDVMVRAVPEVGDDDVKGKLFGIGLKKEITELLGPLDRLPLHLSLMAAYTSMDVKYNMNQNTFQGQNQRAEFSLNAFTAQAIASLNFPVVNFYGGIGYSKGTSSLDMLGTYDLEYTISGGPLDGQQTTVSVQNPLDMDFDASGFRATIGARLSLGFFKLFADYTLQEYNTATAGIAFSFR